MKKYALFSYNNLTKDEKANIIAEVEEIEKSPDISTRNETHEFLAYMFKDMFKEKYYIIRNIPKENIIPAWLLEYIRFETIESEYGRIISVVHIHTGETRHIFKYLLEKGDMPIIDAEDFESAKLFYEVNK